MKDFFVQMSGVVTLIGQDREKPKTEGVKMKEEMKDYRNLEIDQANLDKELATQAARYLFVAERSVGAELEFELYKAKLTQLDAELDGRFRTEALAKGEKVTEGGLAKMIERDESHNRASITLLKLKANKEVLRALKESWYQRKDMLIQLAIKQRSELESLMGGRIAASEGFEGKAGRA